MAWYDSGKVPELRVGARAPEETPIVRSCRLAAEPMGMVGVGAPACVSAIAKPWTYGFAAASRVQVHTTGNDGAVRPTGPTGGSTG